ncbi:hypothetical protein HOC80_04840 [archaeon]|nr:hypothetical protein [archaeon]MBT4417400.1 hypothetical protein [archaeon]
MALDHDEIADLALTFRYNLKEIGVMNDVSKERIRQIVVDYGITGMELIKARKYSEQDKRAKVVLDEKGVDSESFMNMLYRARLEHSEMHQQSLDIMAQVCFDRFIEERGLPYALAWRDKKDYPQGQLFDIDQLELLFRARLQGEGYGRSAKAAGMTILEALNNQNQIRLLLRRGLRDVKYEKPEDLVLKEPNYERDAMIREGDLSNKEIASKTETDPNYVRDRRLELQWVDCPGPKFSVRGLAKSLILKGYSNAEIADKLVWDRKKVCNMRNHLRRKLSNS